MLYMCVWWMWCCRDDYYELFAPRCGGCGHPISEQFITALNQQWHTHCFVCAVRISFFCSINFIHSCHLTWCLGVPVCKMRLLEARSSFGWSSQWLQLTCILHVLAGYESGTFGWRESISGYESGSSGWGESISFRTHPWLLRKWCGQKGKL